MRKIVIYIMLLMIGFTIQAQIPDQIKSKLTELVKKVAKESDKAVIKEQLNRFVSNAPNESSKKAALSFIKKESTSNTVKSVVDELMSSKIVTKNGDYKFLKNVGIINMISNELKKGNILIKNDKIQAIDYTKKRKAPESAKIFDLSGKYLIPGLIDAHVHITHGTFNDAKHHLHEAVKNGVTSVRDMGGDGRMLTLLKRNTLIGENIGADVYFSTIIAGPDFFINDKRPQSVALGAKAGEVSWQRAITNDTDLKQVISEVKGIGATAIKVYMNVEKNLFKKVADEAKRQGLKVWAHAVVPPTKAIDITNGGADVMSHAGDMIQYEFIKGDLKDRYGFKNREELITYRNQLKNVQWDENTLEVKRLFSSMKNNNSILDATLHVYDNERRSPDDLKNALKAVRIASKMGVKVGAGSDNMITEEKGAPAVLNIHGEIELLTKAGLSNFEALQAATIINAEMLGEENNIGTIENGKIANLVILNANPLEDIRNTKKIDFVLKRGKIVK